MPTVKRYETEVTYDLLGLTEREARAIHRLGGTLMSKDNPLEKVYALLNSEVTYVDSGQALGRLRASTPYHDKAPVYVLFFESQQHGR